MGWKEGEIKDEHVFKASPSAATSPASTPASAWYSVKDAYGEMEKIGNATEEKNEPKRSHRVGRSQVQMFMRGRCMGNCAACTPDAADT